MGGVWTAELLLQHPLCGLRGSYGVRVSMHHLPGAPFGPKDHRDPQSERSDVLPSVNLRLRPCRKHQPLVGHLKQFGSYLGVAKEALLRRAEWRTVELR